MNIDYIKVTLRNGECLSCKASLAGQSMKMWQDVSEVTCPSCASTFTYKHFLSDVRMDGMTEAEQPTCQITITPTEPA